MRKISASHLLVGILSMGTIALCSCGGGGGGGSGSTASGSTASGPTISGYAVDGPFSANIYIYNQSGSLCGSGTSSSSDGSFNISLSANCSSGPYLIKAIATSGTDAGEYYYIADASTSNIYITPVSTAYVRQTFENNFANSYTSTLTAFENNAAQFAKIEQNEINYNVPQISFTHVYFTYSTTISNITLNGAPTSCSMILGTLSMFTYPTSSSTLPVMERFIRYMQFVNCPSLSSYFSSSTIFSYARNVYIANLSSSILSMSNPSFAGSYTLSAPISSSGFSVNGFSYTRYYNNLTEIVNMPSTGNGNITISGNTLSGNTLTASGAITSTGPISQCTPTLSLSSNTLNLSCGSTTLSISRSITNNGDDYSRMTTFSGMIGGISIGSHSMLPK